MSGSVGGKTKIFDLDGEVRWLPIPEGYYRVVSGAAKPTDLSLCLLAYFATKKIVWDRVGDLPGGDTVNRGSVIIRKGVPVDPVCPRCEGAKPVTGWKYCRQCLHEVRRELRSAERD